MANAMTENSLYGTIDRSSPLKNKSGLKNAAVCRQPSPKTAAPYMAETKAVSDDGLLDAALMRTPNNASADIGSVSIMIETPKLVGAKQMQRSWIGCMASVLNFE